MLMIPPVLLLVEDEPTVRGFVRTSLTDAGFHLEEAGTGQQALSCVVDPPPNLLLVDLGLPDMNGQEILSRLRERFGVPIIVLSTPDQEQQKIAALDRGADDFLTKPFSAGELLARVRVALRHTIPAAAEQSNCEPATVACGDLQVDLTSKIVRVKGFPIRLTPIEYKLLKTLARNAGKVLTHRYLLRNVWGQECVQETRYLRVFMSGLRRKIEADPAHPRYLLTEQGIGYRLATQ